MNYPHGEFDPTPLEETRDILHEQASFLQDLATLISELPESRQAESESHTFAFPVFSPITQYEFPIALRTAASTIDNITITIGDAHTPEYQGDEDRPAYLSIDLAAGPTTYTVSRSGVDDTDTFDLYKIDTTAYHHGESNDTFEPRVQNAGTITKAELNALLMSIALPNSLGDYSAYADKELQSSEAFESLKELLSQNAYGQRESVAFLLCDGEVDMHFTREGNQLTSFTLNYYDEKQRLPVVVEYDIDSEFRLSFFGIDDGEKRPLIPTADEINYVRRLLQEELTAIESHQAVLQEDVIADDHEIEARARVAHNELSAQADEALTELGLNPPDTSA